jgi:heptosyltransferase-3
VKVLLAKLNHLGDALLLTPTIRFLKESFPEAEIDVLLRAGCEEVLRGNPDVHQVFLIGHSKENQIFRNARGMMLKRYDYAFDLSDSGRAKLWILLSAARIRGVNDAYNSVGWERRLFNRISHFQWGEEHQVLRDFHTVADTMELKGDPGPLRFHPQVSLAQLQHKLPWLESLADFAVIHPTSRWAFKQWLPERWGRVADEISRRQGLAVVFSTGPAPRERRETFRIIG